MHILSIGTDRKLFEVDSAIRQRMASYASRAQSLHVIVYATKNLPLYEIHDGKLHIYPTRSNSRWLYVYDAYKIAKKIITSLGEEKTEVVISSQDPFETGLVGLLVAREYNRPLQVQLHTDIYSSQFGQSFLNRIRRVIASYILPRAQGIRAVSRTVADSLIQHFGKDIAQVDILPVFIDKHYFEDAKSNISVHDILPGCDSMVCMVSRLSPEKNIDVAIRAFAKVILHVPRIGLCIVGSGVEEGRLRMLVNALGIETNVALVGWHNDPVAYYKASDVFLTTSSYEGYGVTLIEAALSGSAIVTTPVGIAREICIDGENSYICPIGDVDSVASRIETLISDQKIRELFKTKMRATITGMVLDRDQYVQVYIGLLEKLLHIHGYNNKT